MERYEFFDRISKFYDLIKEDANLKKIGIESVSLLQEPFNTSGLNPTMIFKKEDKTQYSIKGEENIVEHMEELKKIIKS